ncbi:hypothetical protein BD560DRAFT_487658, partial [Blakeslea trispora]
MHTILVTGLLLFQLAAFFVHAQSCAAEANFQLCKKNEETELAKCGPVDYTCQCKSQNLILQCYNLCPTYAALAAQQSGVAASVCVAVPTTSSSMLPSTSASLQPSSTTSSVQHTASAPSSSTTSSSSFAHRITPFVQYAFLIAFLTISVVHLV